jgi:O-antigen ligase
MTATRVGLCVLIVFAVLAHGAVEVWSQAIVEIVAGLLLCLWVVIAYSSSELKIQWSLLNWPILGFMAIGLLQILLHTTAYPFHTRTEILRVAACWIVFFLGSQAFRTRADLRTLAWFLMILCFVVSLLAIAQYFTAGNEIYWFRPVTGNIKPFGPYVNRNHFAGFVELTLPTGVAVLLLGGSRREKAPLAILMALVPIGAVVLSASRAGIIGVALEIVVLAILSMRKTKWGRGRLVTVASVGAVAMVLIGWIGAGTAFARFLPNRASEVSVARRISMLKGAMGVFLAHPIAGSGLGTIVDTYPSYETMYDGKLVDHVHNDYAEALAETGIIGGVCGLAFLWIFFRKAESNFKAEQGNLSRALHAGAIAAVVGLLWHSFVDFNLHILSNVLLFLIQASVGISPPGASSRARWIGKGRAQSNLG